MENIVRTNWMIATITYFNHTQPAFTCSKLTIETQEQICSELLSLLLTLNIFHTLFYCFFVNFEQVNAGWGVCNNFRKMQKKILKDFAYAPNEWSLLLQTLQIHTSINLIYSFYYSTIFLFLVCFVSNNTSIFEVPGRSFRIQ